MTGPAFETFLARLYTDPQALASFLADPHGEAARGRLTRSEIAALLRVDAAELQLAATSFAHKRARAPTPRLRRWWQRALRRSLTSRS
jgi:hypothetical protein